MTPLTLRAWLEEHGPLGGHEAAFVASACASRLLQLQQAHRRWTVRDLDSAHIQRDASGTWVWQPTDGPAGRDHVTERDVVKALGRLTYDALVGGTPGTQTTSPLRRHRPDLPLAFDALVGRALAGETALSALAVDLQHHLGARPSRLRVPPSLLWVVGLVLTMTTIGAVLARDPAAAGATAREAAAEWEAAYGLAWMDEQSAAATFAAVVLRGEIQAAGPQSPQAWWVRTWLAWLKQQVGDYLTAEQYGGPSSDRLRARLGASHPLALAAAIVHHRTLLQRGAQSDAAALRDDIARAHAAASRVYLSADSRRPYAPDARFDQDRDGDGLADLLELVLGTSPGQRATAGELLHGHPVRGFALPLSPAHVVAHLEGIGPGDEGFQPTDARGHATWLAIMPSVQRGYAERFGWVLIVEGGRSPCDVELDTGRATRRLLVPSSANGTRVVIDFEATTRRLSWWSSDGAIRETAFDDLPPSGTGPYGLRLRTTGTPAACGSVSWLLRGAAIAPM